MQSVKDYVKDLCKNRIPTLVINCIYIAFCLSVFVYFIVTKNISASLSALVNCALIFVVYLFEVLSDLRIPALLLALFFTIPAGSILGSNFDFYVTFPWFDDFLHTVSGFLFACLGFGLFRSLCGDITSKKTFLACLFGGLFFSLACAMVWELYEYFSSTFFGFDMQEDSVINSFTSYYLSGTHSGGVTLDNITKTIIYYGDNQTFVVEGGYLDTGLFDTLSDLIVCFIGSIVYTILVLVGKKSHFYDKFCPTLKAKQTKEENA